jgi:hypothetical protein
MSVRTFIKNKFLPAESNFYAKSSHLNLQLNNAISRCAAGAAIRQINPAKPATWEFSGFSQKGEDGIIDYLLTGLNNPVKYFIEIGSGNGLENNTSFLSHIKKFAGLQIEGNPLAHNDALIIKPFLIECLNLFVEEKTIETLYEKALFKNPDVFSIDIDGMDYYMMTRLLDLGLRPKIVVVEYNSAFGPQMSITIPYNAAFDMFDTQYPYLYYGVSINGWKNTFLKYGYEFLTVETNGVNAFFIKRDEFKAGFAESIEKNEFKENLHQLRLLGKEWEGQLEMMKISPLLKFDKFSINSSEI